MSSTTTTGQPNPVPGLGWVYGHFSPSTLRALLHLVIAITVAVRPRPSIRAALSALLIYVGHQLSLGCTPRNYGCGANYGLVLLNISLFLWLDNPMKWRYHNVHDAALPETYPLWKRVYYAASLAWNPRLIGWNTQVANVPPPMTKSKIVFLQQGVVQLAKGALAVDLAKTFAKLYPFYALRGTPAFPTGLHGYVMDTLCVFARVLNAYGHTRLWHTALAMFCVATGLGNGDPEMWPDLFGRWSDAYTVRRFWGRTWHQMTRGHLSACGKTVASALGFKKGTNGSAYAQLYTAFVISGMFHSFGDVSLGAPMGKSMPFFLWQAVVITFEDSVIAAARRLGVGSVAVKEGKEGSPPWWARVFGYVWVSVWLSYSVRLYVSWSFPAGVGSTYMPFSILQKIIPYFCEYFIPNGSVKWRLPRLVPDCRLNFMKISLYRRSAHILPEQLVEKRRRFAAYVKSPLLETTVGIGL
ncbi:hypothetical protein GSI_09271 [Ganoderma sinense ZZ0214-1]|uniref:Wax synthase domain-containing protein n=1 Tax=Ganoderma sinense ZZ0214-1 TaxID=1077348 RepID=A0A2G8S618_9APHY|nr:hypothetical protein GSI_09271 [Ganoderma sinense ZZ0214-1]